MNEHTTPSPATHRSAASCHQPDGRVQLACVVNATDPDIVTLGGLASARAFAANFSRGLMRSRRDAPPDIRAARYLDDGPLHGAIALGTDAVLTEDGLQRWAAERGAF